MPGEGNSDALIRAVNLVQVPVRSDLRPVTLNPCPENRTGLVGAASGGRRSPEAHAAPPPAPFDVVVHERDEWFELALPKGFVGLPDHIDDRCCGLCLANVAVILTQVIFPRMRGMRCP